MRKKLLVALVLGGAASLLVLLLERAGGVDRFEGVTWNWRARALARPGAATDRIRLILLDQSSLNWAKKEYAASWPWMRQMYAPVLAFCRRGGARSVAFDVLFTEPSRDGVEDDRLLGAAMAEAPGFVGTVILGAGEEHSQWPDWLAVPSGLQEGAPHIPAALKSHLVAGTATFPVAETATNTVVLSNVIEQPDEDGLFRRITPLRVFDGRWVPALGMASWVASELRQGRPPALRVDDRAVWMGAHCIPTAADGRALLRYRGASRTHRTYTAAQIIQSELLLAEGRPPLVDPADFKDTHVFFGFSAPGLLDLRPTPVARAYPGVEIHATALDNLLSGDFIRPVSRTVSWSVTLLLAVLGAGVVLAGRRAWHSAAAMVAGVPGLPLALGFAAYAQGWEWPVAGPLLTLLVSMTGALVYNYATEGRQKAFIKSAFRHYLGPEVIEQILEDPSRLKLGGEKRELTIFFSDIEKFSTFSERLDPRDLTALLNEYLTEMGAIIREEGGYLDKYIGDAIVAFWNAPLAQPDHAARAVRAALRCQQRLAERRADYESRYGAVVKMRIGLHTGEVVVGNMGSEDRFNYTILGDAANLASRLEGANKAFGTYAMMSEAVIAAGARDGFAVRELGRIRVVGRAAPVRVFEPLAEATEGHAAFTRALAAGRAGRLQEARTLWQDLADGDAVARKYLEHLRQDPEAREGSPWEPIWNLSEK